MNTIKILVVDDDEDFLFTIRTILARKPEYQIIEARSGKECLEQLTKVEPDLILLDVIMDTDIDGFNVAQQIKSKDPNNPYAKYRDTPIIFLTSVEQKTKLRFADKIGTSLLPSDDFITKPVKPQDLLTRIEEVLKKYGKIN
ncbi:MAG: response regulator [Deltaproteobacteria bacterium]|nr:response regulator [Deltaproteobacteria bacterium]